MKKRTCYLFLVVFAIVSFAACATAHKASVVTFGQVYDSTASAQIDANIVHRQCMDSVSVVLADSSCMNFAITEKESVEETVTEYITEVTDSSGCKIISTARTIQRKGITNKESSASANSWYKQEQTSLLLSLLDSISNSKHSESNVHWAKKDSSSQVHVKDNGNTLNWWDRLCAHIGLIIFCGVFVAVLLFAWKTK